MPWKASATEMKKVSFVARPGIPESSTGGCMHEMALAENVLDLIRDYLLTEGGQRVKTVRLEIGKLSAVEPEAMRFCFDVVAQGTLADGAVLDIIEQEGVAWCSDCKLKVPIAARYDPCPACGGFHLQVMEGLSMRVKELEIE